MEDSKHMHRQGAMRFVIAAIVALAAVMAVASSAFAPHAYAANLSNGEAAIAQSDGSVSATASKYALRTKGVYRASRACKIKISGNKLYVMGGLDYYKSAGKVTTKNDRIAKPAKKFKKYSVFRLNKNTAYWFYSTTFQPSVSKARFAKLTKNKKKNWYIVTNKGYASFVSSMYLL